MVMENFENDYMDQEMIGAIDFMVEKVGINSDTVNNIRVDIIF